MLHTVEAVNSLYYLLYLRGGDAVEHGQAGEALALLGGVAVFTVETAVAQARGGAVQRYIVEYRADVVRLQVVDEGGALLEILRLYPEHVGVVHALFGDDGCFNNTALAQGAQQ